MSERSRYARRPSLIIRGGRRAFVVGAALAALAASCSSAKQPGKVADVAAYSTQYQSGTQGLVAAGVYAYFYDRFSDCTKSTAGGCSVVVCPAQRPAPPDAPAAGTLIFVGMRDSIVLDPPYLYDPPGVQRPQFGPRTSLTLKTTGGADVPAFSARVLGGPSVKLASPAVDGVNPVVVSRASPLEISWTDGTFGEVVAHLDQDTADQRIEVDCRFPATAGKGTVQTTPFAAGPGQLDVRGETLTQVDSGDYRITFRAFSNALTPTGDRVRVAVDLQ